MRMMFALSSTEYPDGTLNESVKYFELKSVQSVAEGPELVEVLGVADTEALGVGVGEGDVAIWPKGQSLTFCAYTV